MLLLYANYNHHICYTTLEGFSMENMKLLLLLLPCDDNALAFQLNSEKKDGNKPLVYLAVEISVWRQWVCAGMRVSTSIPRQVLHQQVWRFI